MHYAAGKKHKLLCAHSCLRVSRTVQMWTPVSKTTPLLNIGLVSQTFARTTTCPMFCTKDWLEAFVAAGIQLHALASAPARLWHGGDAGGGLAPPPIDTPEHRDEVTRACEAALGRTVAGRGGQPLKPQK